MKDHTKGAAAPSRKYTGILIWNFVLTALVVGILAGGWYSSAQLPGENKREYTLYIGLNDQDTYQQAIDTEEAKQIVNAICLKYTGGYTVMEAEGGWIDETDQPTVEKTLCYILTDIDPTALEHIMDEALEALNQNSILLQARETSTSYYSRKKE